MSFNIRKIFYAEGIVFELTRGIIFLILILIIINFFIATIFVVQGASMQPNFKTGDVVLINKISYLVGKPQRGDIVALKFPGDPEKQKYIKRLIGLPGEILEIKNSQIFINGKLLLEPYNFCLPVLPDMKTIIGNDEFFFIGDNRPNSNDSRSWGTARKNDLIGKAFFNLLPASSSYQGYEQCLTNRSEINTSRWGFIAPVYYNF